MRTATGGKEALALIDESVDVVLLDRRMPELNGDEMVRTLRDRGYDMPVGMVSAINPDRDIITLPIDDYLTKPIDSEELLEAVELLAIRADFNPTCREYFRLLSKKSVFEAGDRPGTDDTEAIREVVTRIEALREDTDDRIDSLCPGDITDPADRTALPDRVWDLCLSTHRASTDVQR